MGGPVRLGVLGAPLQVAATTRPAFYRETVRYGMRDADPYHISHVFEVQRKGNVDAALAKLKRAYDAQRSRPFLVVASERDTNRAERQLSLARTGPFHEIGRVTTILSFEQLRSLHRALTSVEAVLANFFER